MEDQTEPIAIVVGASGDLDGIQIVGGLGVGDERNAWSSHDLDTLCLDKVFCVEFTCLR
jgi:hypothetical protein